MEISSSYFYLKVSENFKKECKDTILVKFKGDSILVWHGYIWTEDRSIGKVWSRSNYQKENVKLYKVSDAPGVIYRNLVWFYGSKKEIAEKELEAINLFIEQENNAYIDLIYKASQRKRQKEFLENIKLQFRG